MDFHQVSTESNDYILDYSEYFYTEEIDDKWTIKVGKSLPTTLINGSPLITNLVATRQNAKILATSTLVISMPSENSTYAPTFSTSIYYGNYKNTDIPTVELTESISLNSLNFVEISKVYIECKYIFNLYRYLYVGI